MSQEAITSRIKRTRIATQHYYKLQGLKQIPMGLALLLVAAHAADLWPRFFWGRPLLGISAMIAVISLPVIGMWLIGHYYDQRFGKVKQPSSLKSHFTVFFFFVLFYASNWAEWSVSAPLLVCALIYGYAFWFTGQIVYQYLAAACLLVIVSLLPLTGLLTVAQVSLIGPESMLGATIVSLVMIIVGLIDHWWLTRSLQSLRESI